jgi:hypothetical protein
MLDPTLQTSLGYVGRCPQLHHKRPLGRQAPLVWVFLLHLPSSAWYAWAVLPFLMA